MPYQLMIQHIPGQIGINSSDAVLSIKQPRAAMEITTQRAEVNIHSELPKVKIDQSQCFSEAGLKDIFELNEDFAQMGKEAVLMAIGEIVDEGNRMAMIANKRDAIVEIATDKALPGPADFNIKFIPQSRPKIDFEGGISFEPVSGKVNIEVTRRPVEINVQPGSLEIYLMQKPELNIQFVGKNLDVKG